MVTASALSGILVTSTVGMVGHTSGIAIAFHTTKFNVVRVGEGLASVTCWWDGVRWANAPTVVVMRILDSADAVTMLEVYVATSANQATMDSLTAPSAPVILEEVHQIHVIKSLEIASAKPMWKGISATGAKKAPSIWMKRTLLDVQDVSVSGYLIPAICHNTLPLRFMT
jgi:hypothetical protein